MCFNPRISWYITIIADLVDPDAKQTPRRSNVDIWIDAFEQLDKFIRAILPAGIVPNPLMAEWHFE